MTINTTVSFAEKKNGIIWRGSSTGYTPDLNLTNTRVYFVKKYGDGKYLVPDIDIGLSNFVQSWNDSHFATSDAVQYI